MHEQSLFSQISRKEFASLIFHSLNDTQHEHGFIGYQGFLLVNSSGTSIASYSCVLLIQISFDYLCMSNEIVQIATHSLFAPILYLISNSKIYICLLKCGFFTTFDAFCCRGFRADELLCANTQGIGFSKHSDRKVHKSHLMESWT